jgi:hypothetical protein
LSPELISNQCYMRLEVRDNVAPCLCTAEVRRAADFRHS